MEDRQAEVKIKSPFGLGFKFGCGAMLGCLALIIGLTVVFPAAVATCIGGAVYKGEQLRQTGGLGAGSGSAAAPASFAELEKKYGAPLSNVKYTTPVTMPINGKEVKYDREVIFSQGGAKHHYLLLEDRIVYSD